MVQNQCHRFRRIVPLLVSLVTLAGCGGVRPVTGGTEGTLDFGDQLLSDIQVSVHERDGTKFTYIGFGVTDRDGGFTLVTDGAKGPLWLSPGEYCFTLESAGAPVEIPNEYLQPETSPLKVSWSGGEDGLELKVASKLLLP
jgi:hypothetical protein